MYLELVLVITLLLVLFNNVIIQYGYASCTYKKEKTISFPISFTSASSYGLGMGYWTTITREQPMCVLATNAANFHVKDSASSSGISVSSTGLVTGTRIGSGIAIATNGTTKCQDNVRFQVYDEERITINSVEMESDGLD